MKPFCFLKVTAFLGLFSTSILRADWQWENDLVIAKSTPKGYEAVLTFLNKGKSNITVTSLKFACPCTVYHFTATTVKPGETGVLNVLIEREGDEALGREFAVIASGPPSTHPRELTIRIEKTTTDIR